jgi:hypothetical protein
MWGLLVGAIHAASPVAVRWPPFCASVDFLVAAILAIEVAYGLSFH